MLRGSSVILRSSDGTMPFSCSTSATSRCSGVISAWVPSDARFCAVITASCAFSVNLFKFMAVYLLRGAMFTGGAVAELRERLVMRPLFRSQMGRQLDLNARVRIALVFVLADGRHAVSL